MAEKIKSDLNYQEGQQSIDVEQAEVTQEQVDGWLEFALKIAARKINEGNNGVVLEVEFSKLPAEIQAGLFGIHPDLAENNGESVFKILKIYTGGQGKKEFELQQDACQILADSEISGVSVPKPEMYRDLEIKEGGTAKLLEDWGIKVGDDKRIEILSMDLVKGYDLATWIYRQFILQHPQVIKRAFPDFDFEGIAQNIQSMDIDSLVDLVCKVVGFKHKYRHLDDSSEAIEERRQLALTIKEKLEHKSLLDKEVVELISTAINTLHRAGLYHRDLHLRNIMIERLLDGKDEIKILDFGNAKKVDPNNERAVNGVYKTNEERDEGVIKFLRSLASGLDDRNFDTYLKSAVGKVDLLRAKINSESTSVVHKQIYRKAIAILEETNSSRDVDQISDLFMQALGKTTISEGYEEKMVALLELANTGRKDEVVELCAKIAEDNHGRSLIENHFRI